MIKVLPNIEEIKNGFSPFGLTWFIKDNKLFHQDILVLQFDKIYFVTLDDYTSIYTGDFENIHYTKFHTSYFHDIKTTHNKVFNNILDKELE